MVAQRAWEENGGNPTSSLFPIILWNVMRTPVVSRAAREGTWRAIEEGGLWGLLDDCWANLVRLNLEKIVLPSLL